MQPIYTQDGDPIVVTPDEESAFDNGTYSPTLYGKLRQSAYPPLWTQVAQICKCLEFLQATGVNLGPNGTALVASRAQVVAQYPKPAAPQD